MSTTLEKRREQNRKAQRKHRSKVRELIKSRTNQDGAKLTEEESEQSLVSSSIIFGDNNAECIQSSQICLPKFQLAQALSKNAERMGIPDSVLTNYWSISTIQQGWESSPKKDQTQIVSNFIPANINIKHSKTCLTVEDHQSISNWKFDRIPQNMLPTPAQLSIEHHPYIDCVFPWASMRSKILLLMESIFTEEQLCQETLTSHERYGEPAFTVWGDDPMDESSWEVSQSFATNWWFLLDRQIINRTNWWRRQQERPELSEVYVMD
ncbi:uncharacterized protein FA14DRAFT_88208 [Meira miltonrushii]|uniref:BZIP domain-containing protein n=1 Tax=Meira miltonrushii TaxID=1280837 RepID=A0A316V2N2_9BASI|nr:uncharacterized protein FA14DRAFT_88208 [Meira miltonrushii]PWN31514.1 hypothetical protein FA14DRAFT_88208 [Meira miltonrushii]